MCPDGDYEAVKERLESLKEVELTQKTPVRVLHRRSNMERKRTVYSMSVSRDGLSAFEYTGLVFKLRMATQVRLTI